jgi:hypothetical protein
MVYRDAAGDLRTAQLRSLVATEPTLQDAARRLRFEQDDANDEVDRLGRELATAERDVERARAGGLWSWFARGRTESEGAVRVLRDALEHAMAQLDELVAQEGTIRAQLEAIAAARVELAAREARAGDMLRAADSPAGADYRAIDTAIAREAARLVAVEIVLRAVELADVAIGAVVQVAHDAAEADAGRTGLAIALEVSNSIGARAADAVEFAKGQLRGLVDEIQLIAASEPALVGRLRVADVQAYVAAPVPDHVDVSPLVTRAWLLARALSTMLTAVAAERDRIRTRRSELENRQRDAAARYLAGDAVSSEVA